MLEIKKGVITLIEFADDNEEEFGKYVSWVRNPDNMKTIARKEYLLSMDYEQIRNYVRDLNRSENDSFFKVYCNEEFIGTFKIGHIDWHLGVGDLGIMIGDPNYKGKGLSKEIIRLGIEYAFYILCLRRLIGQCFSVNKAMCRCFEDCGFIKEGVLREEFVFDGGYCDHIIYGLLRKDYYREEEM